MELTNEQKNAILDAILNFVYDGLNDEMTINNPEGLVGSNLKYHLKDIRFLRNYCVKQATLSPMANSQDVDMLIEFFRDEECVEVLMSMIENMPKVDAEQLSIEF